MAIETLNDVAAAWSASLLRASVQGALAIAVAWLLVRCQPGLPTRVACWVWRLADLKLIVALVWAAPLLLPLLPPVRLLEPIAVPVAAPAPTALATSHPTAEPPPAIPVARGFHASPTAALCLFLMWLGGVAALGVVFGRDALAVRRLRRSCPPIESPLLRAAAADLARELGLRAVPELRSGAGVARPMLVGVFRPAILLPPGWLSDPHSTAEVPAVLAHELAHVRRRDLAWSGLTGLARTLFFFHPLVWLAHREALAAREAACDAMALAASGLGRAEYARILLHFAAAQPPGHVRSFPSLGIAGSAGARSLKRRFKAMRHDQNPSRRRLLSWGLALLVAGPAAIVPWKLVPRAVLAQEQGQPVALPGKEAVSKEDEPAPSAYAEDQARHKAAEARIDVARAEQKVAEAIVKQGEAEVARASAERDYRVKQYNRGLDLFKRAAIPSQLVDDYESKLHEAQAAAHEAEARLASARFGVDAAAASVREAGILRDIDGIWLRMRRTGPEARSREELKKAQDRLLAARLDRARTERDAARADVERAEANLQKATANLAYHKKLLARHQELLARQAIEPRLVDDQEHALARARNLEDYARNALELSRTRLKAAEARLEAVKAGGPGFDPLFPPASLPR